MNRRNRQGYAIGLGQEAVPQLKTMSFESLSRLTVDRQSARIRYAALGRSNEN